MYIFVDEVTQLTEIEITDAQNIKCMLNYKLFDHVYKYCVTDGREYGDEKFAGKLANKQPWCYSTDEVYERTGIDYIFCHRWLKVL